MWRKVVFGLLAFAFVLSVGMLLYNNLKQRSEMQAFESLSAQIKEAERAPIRQPSQNNDTELAPENTILPKYAAVAEQNPDFFGWLTVEGTNIDYPVMATPEDGEYYLHRDFAGNDSYSGTPFVGMPWEETSANTIVYGHNMKNGTMFAELLSYANESFFRQHPTIYFDTLYAQGEYRVLAAFRTKVFTVEDEDVFRYYYYSDLSTREDFEQYVSACMHSALYDTGEDAQWGDTLLTLSTCAYHTNDGRFVVVAKKIN